jgi:hypothetical protein
MDYESFDRFEIVRLLGELCTVVPKHHKHDSTTKVDNFERPNYQIVSMASVKRRVLSIGPSASLRILPDAKASRCAPRLDE